MTLRKTGNRDGKTSKAHGLPYQLDGLLKTIGMRAPIGHALGWIAAERQHVFDALFFEPSENRPSIQFGLTDHGEVTHDLQTAFAVDGFNQTYGFIARASARPVRDRTKARIEPLDDGDFAKEVFLALFCLWRKELNREGQPRSGIEVGQLHANP